MRLHENYFLFSFIFCFGKISKPKNHKIPLCGIFLFLSSFQLPFHFAVHIWIHWFWRSMNTAIQCIWDECTPSDTKSLGLCFVALNLPFHNWHIFGLHIKDPHRVSDRTKLDIIHVNLPSLFSPPSSVSPEFLAINGTRAYHRWSSIRMLGINLKLSVASREY